MTVTPLDQRLRVARLRLGDAMPDLALVDFDNDPHEVARWLDDAATAATNGDFVIAASGRPATLYLWMNEFVSNPDRWFLAASAMGPERPAEDTSDWRDALIGDEIGDPRVPPLTLSGMASVQAWFADRAAADSERSAVEEVVLLAAFDLVARSLRHTKAVPYRVAMSRSEEWQVCVWDTARDAVVHTWVSTPE